MADISKIQIQNATYDVKDETARNDIATIKTDVTQIQNKRFIFIGDSYAMGYTPQGYITGWADLIKSNIGLSNDDCLILKMNGIGFIDTDDGAGNDTALTLLQNSNMSNPETVSNIVICLGANDAPYTQSNLEIAVANFYAIAQNKYPNAKVQVGMIGNSHLRGVYNNLIYNVLPAYKSISKFKNGEYLNNTEFILHNNSFMASDGLHVLANGQNSLAQFIYEAIMTGTCSPRYNGQIALTPYTDEIISSNISYINYQTDCNSLKLLMMGGSISLNKSFGTHNGFTFKTIFQVDQWVKNNNCSAPDESFIIPVITKINNKYYQEHAIILVYSNSILMGLVGLNDDGTNYLSGTITEILIPYTNFNCFIN